ncbi:MAG TPA: DUF72 domain-containing protein [Polyangiaceae bacterium]|jgi:uncharacterized protein YecE (DUF72 family)|nr:DUF72 domain-containing protein [Polyangiaceae bacterium]
METASAVHVGRPTIEGAIARYARAFDFVEVIGEPGRHPRRPGLLEWRRQVPERFVFSVVVHSSLSSFEQRPDRAELLSHSRMVADALAADWWLVRTPPSVTPSARATRELEALIGELRDERRIAWEPRGLWNDDDALRVAEQLNLYLVRDLAKEERKDERPIVYTRLRALGEGARIGAAAAERVAERLADSSDCYVIVEGSGAGRVRQVLREMAGVPQDDRAVDGDDVRVFGGEGDEDDDEDDVENTDDEDGGGSFDEDEGNLEDE